MGNDSREIPATNKLSEGNEMDFLLTFALVVLLIVVPVVAGMAMGYGLESDDDR